MIAVKEETNPQKYSLTNPRPLLAERRRQDLEEEILQGHSLDHRSQQKKQNHNTQLHSAKTRQRGEAWRIRTSASSHLRTKNLCRGLKPQLSEVTNQAASHEEKTKKHIHHGSKNNGKTEKTFGK